jgi:hypothetical protein
MRRLEHLFHFAPQGPGPGQGDPEIAAVDSDTAAWPVAAPGPSEPEPVDEAPGSVDAGPVPVEPPPAAIERGDIVHVRHATDGICQVGLADRVDAGWVVVRLGSRAVPRFESALVGQGYGEVHAAASCESSIVVGELPRSFWSEVRAEDIRVLRRNAAAYRQSAAASVGTPAAVWRGEAAAAFDEVADAVERLVDAVDALSDDDRAIEA